jgi:hypothetical protein
LFMEVVWQAPAGSCRSRRANLQRYQACLAGLRALAVLPLNEIAILVAIRCLPLPDVVHGGALVGLQFGSRSRLAVLERRVETLHPKVAVRFRTPSKGSRSNVFSAT